MTAGHFEATAGTASPQPPKRLQTDRATRSCRALWEEASSSRSTRTLLQRANWCVVNVKVDKSIDEAAQRGETVETAISQLPQNTLRMVPPMAVCSGFSLILRDVTRTTGLTSHILQGKVRLPISGGTGGHCWTVFTFPGDLHIPADTSRSASRAEVLKYGGKIRRLTNLPRRREEWELYHATYYNYMPIPRNIINRGDPRESVAMLEVPETKWLAFDTYGQYYDIYFPLRAKLLFR